ncbi:hypothetical protein A9995_03455 [Erythrobacter sp. QSSC1-22B]|uniref:hypothetical protein n=1 Tax=Erythrobacter sp. QSSC1-22B TaxID=1860125 RepID=UPI000804F829|nr:hypothetical protein [Erythrobacter sp. QSSC1-22B]OBX20756.1 hypothetical protein A9995_03455 [Erythrobacter sp. QSSC1-22B]
MRLAGPPLSVPMFASLFLTACSPAPEEETVAEQESQQFETGIYEVDPETGETRAVVNNEDGTTTMRAGERVVPRLPEGFSIYPGAEIRNTIQIGRNDAAGVMVSLASEDSPADLVAFYRRQAEAAGIAIELHLETDAMTMIAGEAPDGTSFAFQSSGETGETTGQLTLRRGLN